MRPTSDQAGALLRTVPPELVLPGARAQIAADNRGSGRRIAVLDDDPTGSQSVHGVQVVTVLEPSEYRSALTHPGSVGFVLTNTRSLSEQDARGLNRQVSSDVYALEAEHGGVTEVVSRSDSCLRGHVLAEIEELAGSSARVAGRGVDGVLFVPSLFSAGRFTLGDVHWATVAGVPTPVGETEYARDATFGYRESRLPEFLHERSGGAIDPDTVLSIPLEVIRSGGPAAVAEILGRASGRQWIIVNAISDHDLDVVVLGLVQARERGRTFLYRSGPSFVRALAGIEPREPLGAADLAPARRGSGHGLIVVGSHTRSTTDQVDVLRRRTRLAAYELDVPQLLDPATRDRHVQQVAGSICETLPSADVLLCTSRDLIRGHDATDSLEIARSVSTGLVQTVAHVLGARPSWVVAKGGITSHDVAVRGLGITRATVIGQVWAGISVLIPSAAPPAVLGMPYVIHPGNVGAPETLADVVGVLQGAGGSGRTAPNHSTPHQRRET